MSITGIGEIANFATDLVNKFWPDKTQAEKDQLALQVQQMTIAANLTQGQIDVNKAEASSQSVFVAGWRPFVGWVCGAAFGWTFVIGPFLSFTLNAFKMSVSLPQLDLSQLSPVLMGMLGLGVMRTVEKVNGLKMKD